MFSTASAHDALVVFADISGVVAKDEKVNINVAKKLSNRLHVCVCV